MIYKKIILAHLKMILHTMVFEFKSHITQKLKNMSRIYYDFSQSFKQFYFDIEFLLHYPMLKMFVLMDSKRSVWNFSLYVSWILFYLQSFPNCILSLSAMFILCRFLWRKIHSYKNSMDFLACIRSWFILLFIQFTNGCLYLHLRVFSMIWTYIYSSMWICVLDQWNGCNKPFLPKSHFLLGKYHDYSKQLFFNRIIIL